MSDKMAALKEYKRARNALKEKVISDEVWPKLKRAIAEAPSRTDQAALIETLEQGNLFNGTTTPEPYRKAVDAFLVAHAPEEYKSLQTAQAAFMDEVTTDNKKFADRVEKAVGSAVEQPSKLNHYFANLGDEQAMALGGIIKGATDDLKPLIITRDEAQRGMDERVKSLTKEIVEKGLLKQDRAEALASDVLGQLGDRIASQAQKAAAKSA